MTNPGTIRYCRKCDEAISWDEKRKRWKTCRNGCSQITAEPPGDTETVLTRGTDVDGFSVCGSALRRSTKLIEEY